MDSEVRQALRVVEPVELGRRVRELRQRAGLTQGQLAQGVASVAYVSRIEAGQRRPEPEIVEGLAKRLQVSDRELVMGEAVAPRARDRLELDYAELELATGSAQAALERLDILGLPQDSDLRHLAMLLKALAIESLGGDPVAELEALVESQHVSNDVWIRAHVTLCRALRNAGDLDAAAARGEAAVSLLAARGLSGVDEAVQLTITLAGVYVLQGQISKALRISRSSLSEAQRLSSPGAQAMAYWNASVCESQVGNIGSALELADRALTLLGSDGDARHRAMLKSNVGAFLLMTDPPDPHAALEALEEAIHELTFCGASATEVARAVVEQARALSMIGEEGPALDLVTSVLERRADLSPFLVAEARVLRGQVMQVLGADGALEQYQEAVLALASTGQDRAVAKLWYQLAARFEEVGDLSAALDAYRRAGVASGVAPAQSMARILH